MAKGDPQGQTPDYGSVQSYGNNFFNNLSGIGGRLAPINPNQATLQGLFANMGMPSGGWLGNTMQNAMGRMGQPSASNQPQMAQSAQLQSPIQPTNQQNMLSTFLRRMGSGGDNNQTQYMM